MDVPTDELVLTLNLGSGTIEGAAYAFEHIRAGTDPGHERVWELDVVRHTDPARVTVRGRERERSWNVPDATPESLAAAITTLWHGPTAVIDRPGAVVAVGHRIVHGGTEPGPRKLTDDVRSTIEQLGRYAPLHNPPAIELVDAISRLLPAATPVAVFDTSFHTTMPVEATAYGGPISWIDRGLRRYGFHGISHHDAAARAADVLGEPLEDLGLVTVHLGGGCSVTAVRRGMSVDTTMGLTPTDGLVMATRSGSIDPGLILYLLRHDGLDVDELESLVNLKSGLLGLTGGASGDIGDVHQQATDGDRSAQLAEAVYVRRIVGEIARVRTSLDQFDALVFTGSAVERRAWLRAAVVEGVAHLGTEIDPRRNETVSGDVDVSTDRSPTRVVCIDSDEPLAIARATVQLINDQPPPR